MLKQTTLMAIALFSIYNQSIQASDTSCISEEMCRNLIKEVCKQKTHGIDGPSIVLSTCCIGCTACGLKLLHELGKEGKDKRHHEANILAQKSNEWFPSWGKKEESLNKKDS